ncbi:hypothetical protein Tco_0342655, partial [Tanacetum coccineum]
MDGGDDGDDDDGDSSRDDAYDEDGDEEEEHLAPADSTVVVSTVKLVSPLEGTEPVIPPPSTDISTTEARITVRLQASISLPPEAEGSALLGARPHLHFHHHHHYNHHYYHHLGVRPKSRHSGWPPLKPLLMR